MLCGEGIEKNKIKIKKRIWNAQWWVSKVGTSKSSV